MKRISFKEWLHKPDEEGATGEMIVVSAFLIIPIGSFALTSIASRTIDLSVLPISLVITFLYVLVYYLFDSKI